MSGDFTGSLIDALYEAYEVIKTLQDEADQPNTIVLPDPPGMPKFWSQAEVEAMVEVEKTNAQSRLDNLQGQLATAERDRDINQQIIDRWSEDKKREERRREAEAHERRARTKAQYKSETMHVREGQPQDGDEAEAEAIVGERPHAYMDRVFRQD